MADIIDDGDIGELEAVENAQQEQQVADNEPDIPEKYRGKDAKSLIKMHQESEKLASRHAQEVGEVRRLADELLKSQFANNRPKEAQQEVDFFENPQEAVRKAIESNPEVIAANASAKRMNQLMAKQEFERLHPDAMEMINNDDFREYINSSPEKMNLFRRADGYDVAAADELFGNYKALKQVRQSQNNEINRAERTKSIKSVSVDSGGSGETGKKVYSSAALRLLQIRDPRKYESMHDEIYRAYQEGRVK